LPVFGVAFVQSYEAFLFMRLLIGAVGASFVITQYHTSVMFASNVVGTANATVAGWGNAGGGAVQGLMPLILAAVLMLGVGDSLGWRLSMIIPGVMMLIMAALYWRYTPELSRMAAVSYLWRLLRRGDILPQHGRHLHR
jgi:NNP family nitrate/nitrite transporter-like MFS transporter